MAETTQAVQANPKRGMKKSTRDSLIAYSFIAPNFIGFCVFTLVPMIFAIALSFCNWDGVHPVEFAGISNFAALLSDKTFKAAFVNTLVYAIGTVFVQLTLGMNAFITAQGFAQIGMRTVLIGAVANIVLDPLFIFALNMGVRGAALATIISQCLSCVWVLRFLTGPKTMLRLKKENIRIAPALVLPCVALGSATFIMQASESVISMCFNSSLLKYGGDIAVGAMTILSSVMQFAMLPLQGIGQGAQPIIS